MSKWEGSDVSALGYLRRIFEQTVCFISTFKLFDLAKLTPGRRFGI
jgi:hypothetical protein